MSCAPKILRLPTVFGSLELLRLPDIDTFAVVERLQVWQHSYMVITIMHNEDISIANVQRNCDSLQEYNVEEPLEFILPQETFA